MAANILILTSHTAFGDLLHQSLEKMGDYQAELCASLSEALDLCKKRPFAIFLLDSDLGSVSVNQAGRELMAASPQSRLIVFPPENNPRHAQLDGLMLHDTLKKPFYLPDLQKVVEDALTQEGIPLPQPKHYAITVGTPAELPGELPLGRADWAGEHLARLMPASTAEAALMIYEKKMFVFVSDLPASFAAELTKIINRTWEPGGEDLSRFTELITDEGEYGFMVYATSLAQGLLLAMIYPGDAPFSLTRSQTLRIAQTLQTMPKGDPSEVLAQMAAEAALASQMKPTAVEEGDSSGAQLETDLLALFGDIPTPDPAARTEVEIEPPTTPPASLAGPDEQKDEWGGLISEAEVAALLGEAQKEEPMPQPQMTLPQTAEPPADSHELTEAEIAALFAGEGEAVEMVPPVLEIAKPAEPPAPAKLTEDDIARLFAAEAPAAEKKKELSQDDISAMFAQTAAEPESAPAPAAPEALPVKKAALTQEEISAMFAQTAAEPESAPAPAAPEALPVKKAALTQEEISAMFAQTAAEPEPAPAPAAPEALPVKKAALTQEEISAMFAQTAAEPEPAPAPAAPEALPVKKAALTQEEISAMFAQTAAEPEPAPAPAAPEALPVKKAALTQEEISALFAQEAEPAVKAPPETPVHIPQVITPAAAREKKQPTFSEAELAALKEAEEAISHLGEKQEAAQSWIDQMVGQAAPAAPEAVLPAAPSVPPAPQPAAASAPTRPMPQPIPVQPPAAPADKSLSSWEEIMRQAQAAPAKPVPASQPLPEWLEKAASPSAPPAEKMLHDISVDETQPAVVYSPRTITPLEPASVGMANLTYTCVFIPRLPQHYLAGKLLASISKWMPQICVAFGWQLEGLSIRPDYMQWIIRVSPAISPGKMLKILRQRTSQRIFNEFPNFKLENPSGDFWAPGYLIVSGARTLPTQALREYITQTRQRQGTF